MRKLGSKKSRKKTAFVPQGLFLTALAATSVIPVCACGGSVTGNGSLDGGSLDGRAHGVATDAFLHADVATQAFDARSDHAAPGDALEEGVALQAFDGSTDASDGGLVFGVAVGGFDVAAQAFDGGK
jgi:hypothetical protein